MMAPSPAFFAPLPRLPFEASGVMATTSFTKPRAASSGPPRSVAVPSVLGDYADQAATALRAAVFEVMITVKAEPPPGNPARAGRCGGGRAAHPFREPAGSLFFRDGPARGRPARRPRRYRGATPPSVRHHAS